MRTRTGLGHFLFVSIEKSDVKYHVYHVVRGAGDASTIVVSHAWLPVPDARTCYPANLAVPLSLMYTHFPATKTLDKNDL